MHVCFLKDGIKNWSFNFIAKKLGFHNILVDMTTFQPLSFEFVTQTRRW